MLSLREFHFTQVGVLLLLGIFIFNGCASTEEAATSTASVMLDGRILYPDETIVEDQIVDVKLEPGPDTLRVGSGYFNISAMYEGVYTLFLYPQQRAYATAPANIRLERGLNMLDFTIPHHIDGEVPDPGVEQDTTIVPSVRTRLEQP